MSASLRPEFCRIEEQLDKEEHRWLVPRGVPGACGEHQSAESFLGKRYREHRLVIEKSLEKTCEDA